MSSTKDAASRTAATRETMLRRMLRAIEAFHVSERAAQSLGGSERSAAIAAATTRLEGEMHAAIEAAWTRNAADATQTLFGRPEPTVQAARVLESQKLAQKEFASRFAGDVARGMTEEKRRIPEPTRAAMYADASESAYQTAAAVGVPDGTLIWWRLGEASKHCWECPVISASSPYTRETLPTTPRAGATPCRSRCKCYLTTSLAKGVTPPLTPEQQQSGRRFEERILSPPPTPPGKRLPDAEERGVLRDLEIQRNHARRKLADANAEGRKAEAKLWAKKSRELTGEIMDYSKARGIHHVPTFSTSEVISGVDVGRRDIDRLTHFRGLDGVTVSRAQVAAIHEATAAAKADVARILGTLPETDAVSQAEWRRMLRENGAPASAFGGELTRLRSTEATEHCGCDECSPRTVRAAEASGDVEIPSPADTLVVNVTAADARGALGLHVAALARLAGAKASPFRVEVGPFDDGWTEWVLDAGTWVQGPRDEVMRFLDGLPGDFAVAPWQPMG